jgi:TPR repeat protein
MNCFGEEEKLEKYSKEQVRQFEKNIKEHEAKNDAKSKNIYDKWKSEAYNKDLEKRASSGDIYAKASLGRCYFIGDGVKQDVEKGISLLRKAAEGGFVVAQCNLGNAIIRRELGIQKDDKNNPASHAYDESSLDYSKLLLCNKDNLKEAAEWVAKAAQQDYIKAQILLAQLYSRGVGVEQNKQEAIKWFKRAAENGSTQAQFKLIQDSITEHEAKLRDKADRGDAEASYEYGMLLLNSQRVKDAREYLAKAAKKGSEKAIKEIKERNKDVFLLDDAVTLSVKANSESKLKDKMNMYQDALVKLKTIKTQNPKWESAIIDYYIKDAESSIEYESRRLKEEQEQENKEAITEDPSQEEYTKIYKIIQVGDKAAQEMKNDKARNEYQEAYNRLTKFRKDKPDWESDLVSYRMRYLREKLGIADSVK